MKLDAAIIKSLVLAFFLSLTVFGCSDGTNDPVTSAVQCADGIDNDSDGLIDLNDSGCSSAADDDESDDPAASTAQCADGVDNDSDGLIDLDDPGCSSAADNDESDDPAAPTAQCADGIDNDSDGLIDLNDPGCSSAADNDESDDPAASTAQCADGIDNDSDGLTDLDDPGCSSADDNDESDDPASSGPDAVRANSYDDAWESDWVANAKTIFNTPVTGISKTDGKVLQVGDSMTVSRANGAWARNMTGATASDLNTINWMHAGASDSTDGWSLSSGGITAKEGAGWGSSFVDNIFVDKGLNDAQFAVVMFNVNNITFVEGRINEFINAGIIPVLSTIPPRTHPTFDTEFGDPYNEEIRALAERLSLPIIDFSKEILLRRPGGTWANTLISADGVHPSGGVNGYTPSSDPYADGGDASTHTTGDATLNSGYLLRTWLTVQKMKEIKQKVVD